MFAALYDRLFQRAEARGLAERRRRLLAGATGRVLEIGGGTGLNLRHYHGIRHLTVLEPDAGMRRRLLERLSATDLAAEVHEAGIDDAPFPDGSFDTVVSTLALCTVPDPVSALVTARRLLVPEGRFLFIEHVLAPGVRGRAQRLFAPVWRQLAGGCHLDRDAPAALREAGFVITDLDRFHLSGATPLAAFAVQGSARPKMAT